MVLAPDANILSLPSGVNLHVEHTSPPSGVPSPSTPILFIHGLGDSSAIFKPLIEASGLSAHRKIIAFDLEGHGLSPLSGNEVSIVNYAESARELLDAHGVEKAVVVGYSMGGLIATTLASTYPARVTKLILLASIKQLPKFANEFLVARAGAVRKDGMSGLAEEISTGGLSQRSLATLPLARHFVRVITLLTPPEGYALGCEAISKATDPDFTKIEADTLIVSGEEDKTPGMKMIGEYMEKQIPKARAIRLKDLGHLLIAEDAEGIAKVIKEFIE